MFITHPNGDVFLSDSVISPNIVVFCLGWYSPHHI